MMPSIRIRNTFIGVLGLTLCSFLATNPAYGQTDPVFIDTGPFDVNENTGNGVAVGDINANDGDGGGNDVNVTYSVTGGTGTTVFSVNATDGVITVADQAALDRELGVASWTLDVTVTDDIESGTAMATITLNHIDENDVDPIVTDNDPTIDESPGNGFLVVDLGATDGDVTATTFSNWMITGGDTDVDGDTNAPFNIDSNTGEITVNDNDDLDFETGTISFDLTVTVSDGVNTSAPETITVTLNDIAPVITASQMFNVDEDNNGAAPFATVAITGDLNSITFTISNNNPNPDADGDFAFDIDPVTGELIVTDTDDIDRELPVANYVIEVTATDGTTPSVENVSIDINDVNEFIPAITDNDPTIDENLANTSPVVDLDATDGDATAVLQNWTITGGNTDIDTDTNPPFVIDTNTGEITVNDADDLDREAVASFDLTVTVSDGTNTSPSQTITVSLNDLNDVNPVVTDNDVSIDENTLNLSLVVDLEATDGDVTPTVFSNWMITGGNTNVDADGNLPFVIDSNTGEITVNDQDDLDREAIASFDLTVTVSDGTNTSAAETITITLNDINEDPPVVTDNDVAIDETETNGFLVVDLEATDPDATTNLQNWTITGGNTDVDVDTNPPFVINASTGEITINDDGDINFESGTTSFDLTVTVDDDNFTSLAETITITINDVDESPVFVDIGPFNVDENSLATTVVGDVNANNGDGGLNDVGVTYSITAGNINLDVDGNDAFVIASTTGIITVNDQDDLNFEQDSQVTLTVEADDSNTQTSTFVVIDINDLDEDPFFADSGPFNIDENSPNFTVVGDVNAADEEGGTNDAGITYTITAGNINDDADADDLFAIDLNTGVITVNDVDDLDFETISANPVMLTVEANEVDKQSTTTVNITVDDVLEPPTDLSANCALNGINLTWTRPPGVHTSGWDGVLIFARQGSAVSNQGFTTEDPDSFTDNETSGLTFGDGTEGAAGDNSEFVVFKSTNDADGDIDLSNIVPGTEYFFAAYAFIDNGATGEWSAPFTTSGFSGMVTNLVALAGDEEITIQWTNSPNNSCVSNVVIVGRDAANSSIASTLNSAVLEAASPNIPFSITVDPTFPYIVCCGDAADVENYNGAQGSNNQNFFVSKGGGTTTSATFTGFSNNSNYAFRVFLYEVDEMGNGPSGDDVLLDVEEVAPEGDVNATPLGPPANPSSFSEECSTSAEINLSWSKPSGTFNTNWNGIYLVAKVGADPNPSVMPDADDVVDGSGSTTDNRGVFSAGSTLDDGSVVVGIQTTDTDGDFEVSGLVAGTTYHFQVFAFRDPGGNNDDIFSSGTGVQTGTASGITGLAATPGDTQITLNWTNPGDAGSCNTTVMIVANEAGIVNAAINQTNLNLLAATYTANSDWSARSNSNDIFDLTGFGINNTDYVVFNTLDQTAVITGLDNAQVYNFKVFLIGDGSNPSFSTGQSISEQPTDVDIFPPNFLLKQASNVQAASFQVDVQLNEPGTAYYVVMENGGGGTPPNTFAQVKAGQNGLGTTADVIQSGTITVDLAGVTYSDVVSFLTNSTDYDIYIVAEDDEPAPNPTPDGQVSTDAFTAMTDTPAGGVTVTPASTISNLCSADGFVALTDIVVTENSNGNFAIGSNQTFGLTLPTGVQFNTESGTVTRTMGTDLSASMSLSVSSKNLLVTYTVNSTSGIDQFTISGLEVKAVGTGAGDLIRLATAAGGTGNIAGDEPGDGVVHGSFNAALSPAAPVIGAFNDTFGYLTDPDDPGANQFNLNVPAAGGTTLKYFEDQIPDIGTNDISGIDDNSTPTFAQVYGHLLSFPFMTNGNDLGDYTVYVAYLDNTSSCLSSVVPVTTEIIPSFNLIPNQNSFAQNFGDVTLDVVPFPSGPTDPNYSFSGPAIRYDDMGNGDPSDDLIFFNTLDAGVNPAHNLVYTFTDGEADTKSATRVVGVGAVINPLDGLTEDIAAGGVGECLENINYPITLSADGIAAIQSGFELNDLFYPNGALIPREAGHPNNLDGIANNDVFTFNPVAALKNGGAPTSGTFPIFIQTRSNPPGSFSSISPQTTVLYPLPLVDIDNLNSIDRFCSDEPNLTVTALVDESAATGGIFEIRRNGIDPYVPLQGAGMDEINFVNPLNATPLDINGIAVAGSVSTISFNGSPNLSSFTVGGILQVRNAANGVNDGSFEILSVDDASDIITVRNPFVGAIENPDSPAQGFPDNSGFYDVRFTSDIADDPLPNGGPGCTNSRVVIIQITAQPFTPVLVGEETMFEFCEDVNITGTLDINNPNGSNVYKWFDDPGNISKPAFLNPDLSIVNATNGQSMTATELFGSELPLPGTYAFDITQVSNVIPFPGGSTFAGCSSEANTINAIVHPEPDTPELDLSGSSGVKVGDEYFFNYCEGSTVEAITMDLTGITETGFFEWFSDVNLTVPVTVGMDGETASPADLTGGDVDGSNVYNGALPAQFDYYIRRRENQNLPASFAGCISEVTHVSISFHQNPTPFAPDPAAFDNGLAFTFDDAAPPAITTVRRYICADKTINAIQTPQLAGSKYKWYRAVDASTVGTQIPVSGFNGQVIVQSELEAGGLDRSAPGVYYFWVTQVTNENQALGFAGCESPATRVDVTVFPNPAEPDIVNNDGNPSPVTVTNAEQVFEYCVGEISASTIFTLSNQGAGARVTWFTAQNDNFIRDQQRATDVPGDPVLGVTGDELLLSNIVPVGTPQIRYFVVVQTTDINPDGSPFAGCESTERHVAVVINPLPDVSFTSTIDPAYCVDSDPLLITTAQPTGNFTPLTGLTDNNDGTASFNFLEFVGAATPQEYLDTDNPDGTTVTIEFGVTDVRSCFNSVTRNFGINPEPAVTLDGPTDNPFDGSGQLEICLQDEIFTITGRSVGGSGAFSAPEAGSGLSVISLSQATFTALTAGNKDEFNQTINNITYTFTDVNTCVNEITKQVIVNPNPIITLNEIGGCEGDPVVFTASVQLPAATDAINTIDWTFDVDLIVNQNTITPTDENTLNPSVLYDEPGEYRYQLEIVSNKGCQAISAPQNIFVGDLPDSQVVWDGICLDQEIAFQGTPTGVSVGSIEEFRFDYGDGIIESIFRDPNPGPGEPADGWGDQLVRDADGDALFFRSTHKYSTPGIFDLEFNVISNNGCTDIVAKELFVIPTETPGPDNPYFENFENPSDNQRNGVYVNGWVPDLTIRQATEPNTWEFGSPAAGSLIEAPSSGVNAWITGISDGSYAANEDSWVFTPCFDLTQLDRPMVTFNKAQNLSNTRDGVVFEYSTDNGQTWRVLGDNVGGADGSTGVGWYNFAGILSQPGAQGPQSDLVGWSNTDADAIIGKWRQARHKLDEIPLEERDAVIFRFSLSSDGDGQADGFGVDDFFVGERPQTVLIEQFSGNSSNLVMAGQEAIDKILNEDAVTQNAEAPLNNNDAALITYKTDLAGTNRINLSNPSDPNSRVVFYGVESVPTFLINGAEGRTAGPITRFTGNEFNQRSLGEPDIRMGLSLPSAADDQIAVNVDMSLINSAVLSGNNEDLNIRLYIAIVEKTVEDDNFMFRNVLRKMLPDGAGVPLTVSGATIDPVSQTWKIQRVDDPDNLAVVAFIQNNNTKRVIQAAIIDVGDKADIVVTGLADELILDSEDVNIYPNPANEEVWISLGTELDEEFEWALYNQVGQFVKNGIVEQGREQFSIRTELIPSGMYYLRVGNENKRFKHFKLFVNH